MTRLRLDQQIEALNEQQSKTNILLKSKLSSLPNLPLNEVPIGSDESSNKEIEKKGEIRNFNFTLFWKTCNH